MPPWTELKQPRDEDKKKPARRKGGQTAKGAYRLFNNYSKNHVKSQGNLAWFGRAQAMAERLSSRHGDSDAVFLACCRAVDGRGGRLRFHGHRGATGTKMKRSSPSRVTSSRKGEGGTTSNDDDGGGDDPDGEPPAPRVTPFPAPFQAQKTLSKTQSNRNPYPWWYSRLGRCCYVWRWAS